MRPSPGNRSHRAAALPGIGLLTMVGLILAGACSSEGPAPETIQSEGPAPGSEEIPQAFPVPPGAVEFDQLTVSDEQVHVQWETERNPEDVVEHYDSELPASQWEITSRRQGGESTRYRVVGHGWEGAVSVLGSGDRVRVLLQLGRPEGGS